MINITNKAKQALKGILENSVDWPGARLRLMDRGQGKLGLGVDIEVQGDVVVKYNDLPILLVAPDLAANLKQVTLDVENTADGSKLIIIE